MREDHHLDVTRRTRPLATWRNREEMAWHVRWWVAVGFGVIVMLMVLFVATTAVDRLSGSGSAMRLFDIRREANIPTLVNTTFHLAVALFAGIAAATSSESGERRAFSFVAVLAVLLAIDEASSIHERFDDPTRRALESVGIDWPTYAWIIPGAAGAAVVAGLSVRALRQMPDETRRWLVIAAAMFVGGAVGVEAINGLLLDLSNEWVFFVGTMIEETLEMSACVVAGAALLNTVGITPLDGGGFCVERVEDTRTPPSSSS